MRKSLIFHCVSVLCFIVALAFVAPALAAESQTPPDLAQAIDEGVKMLEAKECKAFIQKFIPPKELEEVMAKNMLDKLAKRFEEKKADKLLDALKQIKTMSPDLSDDGQKATFNLEPRGLTFKKIDGSWRISN